MVIEHFNKSGEILPYKGDKYSFIFSPGYYLIELWGASGGGKAPGFGSYISGCLLLDRKRILHIYIGQKGVTDANTAWNGGGKGLSKGGSGGGSTDIRLVDGNWKDFASLKSRIIVASSGGGSQNSDSWLSKGGDAGIISGYQGSSKCTITDCSHLALAYGGSQNSEGIAGTGNAYGTNGKFGYGGNGSITDTYGNGNGGGSGYFGGGGSATSSNHVGSGAGGSSYISGYDGCKAILKTSIESDPQFSLSSIHYSGLKFVNITVKDGNAAKWDGNGQVRITLLYKLGNRITQGNYIYNQLFIILFIISLICS